MVVIQRCAKCSNESVSTTQIVLSSKNNIAERKSTTRAGGLMPKNTSAEKTEPTELEHVGRAKRIEPRQSSLGG